MMKIGIVRRGLDALRKRIGFDRPADSTGFLKELLKEELRRLHDDLVWTLDGPAAARGEALIRLQAIETTIKEVLAVVGYMADKAAGRSLPEPRPLPDGNVHGYDGT